STFVPVLCTWILKAHAHEPEKEGEGAFAALRRGYAGLVAGLVRVRWALVPLYLIGVGFAGLAAYRALELEIFPSVDAGRFELRLKAAAGTRVERAEEMVKQALAIVKEEVGDQVAISVGYVGLIPSSYPINAIFQWSGGPEEAMLRVALRPEAKI